MTMLIHIRFGEADRHEFDVDGELTLDLEALKDLEYDTFQAIEVEMGVPLALFTPVLESGGLGQAMVKRVAVFLALRQAGKTVAWTNCKPLPGRTELEREEGDPASPPVGPSERSSEDAAPASS